jgi:hypothetical protein
MNLSQQSQYEFHKVADVLAVVPPYTLVVRFVDGSVRRYDVSRLFDKYERFKAFSCIDGLIDRVKVDAGGYGVSWNDEIDLSCNELYYGGEEETDPFYSPKNSGGYRSSRS